MKEAKLFRDTEIFGEMDPFVVIQYLTHKERTKTVESGGKNPRWKNEKFEFKIEKLTDKITFRCFDEDSIIDDNLGEITVAVKFLALEGSTSSEWLKLKYKGKASGEIFIVTKYDSFEKKQ